MTLLSVYASENMIDLLRPEIPAPMMATRRTGGSGATAGAGVEKEEASFGKDPKAEIERTSVMPLISSSVILSCY